jgi:RNA polymerase sigma factor (sigma-70 family)
MLVERFLPLARALARRYQRTGEPFDDLFQVACLGLVKAIDRFDLDRDVAFSTYALPIMLGEIKRYLRDRAWSVRVPRGLQELTLRVAKNVVELSTDLHRPPTVAEIARAAAATEEQVLEALQASSAYRATSLETPRGGEDGAGDTLGDTVASTEQGFCLAEDRATRRRARQARSDLGDGGAPGSWAPSSSGPGVVAQTSRSAPRSEHAGRRRAGGPRGGLGARRCCSRGPSRRRTARKQEAPSVPLEACPGRALPVSVLRVARATPSATRLPY